MATQSILCRAQMPKPSLAVKACPGQQLVFKRPSVQGLSQAWLATYLLLLLFSC